MYLKTPRIHCLVFFTAVVLTCLLSSVGFVNVLMKNFEASVKECLEVCRDSSFQRTAVMKENREEAGQRQTKNKVTSLPQNLESEVERRFVERRRQVHAACRKFRDKFVTNVSKTFERSFYSPKHDLFVCASRKSGSSAMRGLIAAMENITTDEQLMLPKRFFTLEGFIRRLERPIRIATVRHPLVRLVSAFRDKYSNGASFGGSPTYPEYREITTFLKANGIPIGKGKLFNFTTFLRLVTQQHTNATWDPSDHWEPNLHWNSAVRFCSFCELEYDYIVKTETYSEDMDYILTQVGEHGGMLPVVHKKSKTSDPFPEYMGYYEGVPAEVLSAICQIFKYDLTFFDYKLTPHIEKVLRSQGKEML